MPTKSCSVKRLIPRDLDFFAALHLHRILNSRQFGALFATSERNVGTIQERLLFLAGGVNPYIAEISKPRSSIKEFKLLQRGMNELVKAERFPTQRVRSETPSEIFRAHDLTTADITVSMALTIRDFYEPATMIDPHSIYSRSELDPKKANHGWRVDVAHPEYGRKDDLFVRPDQMVGFHFTRRPHGKNQRFFCIETNMGKMDYVLPLYERSVFRKLIAAERTFVEQILFERYGIAHPYFLFFFPTEKKRDTAIELAKDVVHDKNVAQAILFATFPTPPTHKMYTSMLDQKWFNAKGEQACLPM